MQPVHIAYTSEINRHLGFWAAWPPHYPIKLGDIVRLGDHSVARVDALSRRNIPFRQRQGASALIEHASTDGVTMTEKVSGQLPPELRGLAAADAGLVIEFHRQHAIYFRAENARVESIDDHEALGIQVLDDYRAGGWKREHGVVTEIVTARDVTVLISAGSAARAELAGSVHGDVAGARFRTVFKQNLHTHIVSQGNLVPLFRVAGVRRRLADLGASSFGPVLRSGGGAHEVEWGSISVE